MNEQHNFLVLTYIDQAAQTIYDRWVADPVASALLPDGADEFTETFHDDLATMTAGAPPKLFPILPDDTRTLIYNLVAARLYQLMMEPAITNDED